MLTIRKLEKSDAERVIFLIKEFLTKNIVDPEDMPRRMETLSEPGPWQCFVAEKDGIVVGFGELSWNLKPSKGWIGWIDEIVVDKPFRGQGLCHQILEELLYVACNRRLAELWLRTNNEIAKHIYEEFGFSLKQEHLMVKKYY